MGQEFHARFGVLAFDDDTGEIAGDFYQTLVVGIGVVVLAVIGRYQAQHAAGGGMDRRSPAGLQSVAQCQIAVVCPGRFAGHVQTGMRFARCAGSGEGVGSGRDDETFCCRDEILRDAVGAGVLQPSLIIADQDGAKHSAGLRLDVVRQDFKHFLQ